jgi:hypothetical protein
MSRQEPKNTLQQDLFLLAKNHYKSDTLTKLDMAKRICAFHILMERSYFKTRDLIFWLMKEFVEAELILVSREKLTRFVLEHGKYQLSLSGNPMPNVQPGSSSPAERLIASCTVQGDPNVPYLQTYFDILAQDLMSEINLMSVLRDGEWSMPFDKPEVDPYIQGLLETAVEA